MGGFLFLGFWGRGGGEAEKGFVVWDWDWDRGHYFLDSAERRFCKNAVLFLGTFELVRFYANGKFEWLGLCAHCGWLFTVRDYGSIVRMVMRYCSLDQYAYMI